MKQWEKAFQEYILADCDSPEEERAAMQETLRLLAQEREKYPEFYSHPMFAKLVKTIMAACDEEEEMSFRAGWEAHRRYLLNAAVQRRHINCPPRRK